ncbi:alcohol dehydrogenase catalytic domain-containing protein [Chloroflexi bacterium TSY]|nr:alcohol dehydrogenase catalytic domain-containing protein [Chloroflexi bacterium TSY]
MSVLSLTDDGPLIETHYQTPIAQSGDALIRVHLAGICSTDLQLVAGYKDGYRGVLGHEFVGTVLNAPENDQMVGQRVVGELNIGCGKCSLCQRGLGKHCRQRESLGIIGRDGAFAEYLTLPISNLHPVPDELPDHVAVFTEPLAAALEVLEQVHVTPQSKVYLIGDGRLGLMIAQVLATTTCDLTVIGRNPSKLAILEQQGIYTIRTHDRLLKQLASDPADIVVEATGSDGGFEHARELVRPMGTIVLKSTFAGGLANFDISSLVVDEVTLVGSRCGPFAPALRLLRQGSIETDALIHARYPLHEGLAALKKAGEKGVVKVLLEIGKGNE